MDQSSTHMSLLGALFSTPDDMDSGTRFMERYRPLIEGVVRSRSIKGADLEDVTQETLRRMLARSQGFQRLGRGSFRAWLRTIAHTATVDWFRGQSKIPATLALDFAREIPAALATEYQTDLMEAAIRKVKLEVHPRTWEMFERTRMNREPAKAVARDMGVSLVTVYNGAQRVTNRLRELHDLFDSMHQE
jgi:RNA polymerase sigma factor (sigma-70 family)